MGEDLRIVRQGGRLVFFRRLGEVLGEVHIRVVVLHAEAAKLRKVSAFKVHGPEAKGPGVHGDHQGGIAAGLRAVDQTCRQFPVAGQVELIKDGRFAGVFDHVLHAGLGERRQRVRHSGGRRRLRGRHVSVKVGCAQADQTDRGQEHRRGKMFAKQLDRQIAFGRADHHPGHDAIARERGNVGALGPPVTRGADTYRYTQSGSASEALRSIEAKSKGYRVVTPCTASA